MELFLSIVTLCFALCSLFVVGWSISLGHRQPNREDAEERGAEQVVPAKFSEEISSIDGDTTLNAESSASQGAQSRGLQNIVWLEPREFVTSAAYSALLPTHERSLARWETKDSDRTEAQALPEAIRQKRTHLAMQLGIDVMELDWGNLEEELEDSRSDMFRTLRRAYENKENVG